MTPFSSIRISLYYKIMSLVDGFHLVLYYLVRICSRAGNRMSVDDASDVVLLGGVYGSTNCPARSIFTYAFLKSFHSVMSVFGILLERV